MHSTVRRNDAATNDRISYGVDEAAAVTGVGRSFLYEAIRVGELATLKLGKRRIVMREDLMAWLATKRAA